MLRADNPHVHGKMDDGFGQKHESSEKEVKGVASAHVTPVMNCFRFGLAKMNQPSDPHPAVALQSKGSEVGIVKLFNQHRRSLITVH